MNITVTQLAKACECHPDTIRRWEREGLIPAAARVQTVQGATRRQWPLAEVTVALAKSWPEAAQRLQAVIAAPPPPKRRPAFRRT